jgi:hypothetical protein
LRRRARFGATLLVEVKSMIEFLPDQQTSHESAPDEGHVGRFSRGLEAWPETPAKLHRGRFSEGLEQLPETARKRRLGRFSDGLERRPRPPLLVRRGSFADGVAATATTRTAPDEPA